MRWRRRGDMLLGTWHGRLAHGLAVCREHRRSRSSNRLSERPHREFRWRYLRSGRVPPDIPECGANPDSTGWKPVPRELRRGEPMASTHIALLRGINVGKAKRVAMAELRALVEGLGYGDVRSLLNSGNIVFTSTKS